MVSLGKSSLSRASYQALFRIVQKYVQIKMEGNENLPRYGKALLIPLHPRYFGLTALILRTVFRKEFKSIPKSLLIHGIFKLIPPLKRPQSKLQSEKGRSYLREIFQGH